MACATSNAASDTQIHKIRQSLAGLEPNDSSFREELGLTTADSTVLTVVTDSIICTHVTFVVDSATIDTSRTPVQYFVMRAGSQYLAYPHRVARPASLWFVDTSFHFIGATVR
jgi:hypothetical protein